MKVNDEEPEIIKLDTSKANIIEKRKSEILSSFNLPTTNFTNSQITTNSQSIDKLPLSMNLSQEEIIELKQKLITTYFPKTCSKKILNIRNQRSNQAFIKDYNAHMLNQASDSRISEHRHFDNIVSQLKSMNSGVLNQIHKRSYEKKMAFGLSKLTPALLFFINSTVVISFVGFIFYSYTDKQKIIDWNKQFYSLLEIEENN